MSLNTRNIKDRRKPRFENFGDAIREVEMLAEAEQRGTLRATGNWALGQAIGHVASWARFPLDGYPAFPPAPWFLRILAPFLRNPFLNRGLPAGGNLGNVPGGTFATETLPTDVAISDLREAFDRLEKNAPTIPNPFLGRLTHDDWIKLNLRHAELHFSFFHPS